MKLKETFTQDDLRTILPSKIALVADILSKRSGEDPVKIMTDFYRSKTYAMLQGPAELCELYGQEIAQREQRS